MKKIILSILFLFAMIGNSFAMNQDNEKHLYVDSNTKYVVVNKDDDVLLSNKDGDGKKYYKLYPGTYYVKTDKEKKEISINENSDETISVKIEKEVLPKKKFPAKQIFFIALAIFILIESLPRKEKIINEENS